MQPTAPPSRPGSAQGSSKSPTALHRTGSRVAPDEEVRPSDEELAKASAAVVKPEKPKLESPKEGHWKEAWSSSTVKLSPPRNPEHEKAPGRVILVKQASNVLDDPHTKEVAKAEGGQAPLHVSGRSPSPASGEAGGGGGASVADPQSDPLKRVGDRLEEMLRQFEEVKKIIQDDRGRMTSIESMVSKMAKAPDGRRGSPSPSSDSAPHGAHRTLPQILASHSPVNEPAKKLALPRLTIDDQPYEAYPRTSSAREAASLSPRSVRTSSMTDQPRHSSAKDHAEAPASAGKEAGKDPTTSEQRPIALNEPLLRTSSTTPRKPVEKSGAQHAAGPRESSAGSKRKISRAELIRKSTRMSIAASEATAEEEKQRMFRVTDEIRNYIAQKLNEGTGATTKHLMTRILSTLSPREKHPKLQSKGSTIGHRNKGGVEAEVELFIQLMCSDIMSQEHSTVASMNEEAQGQIKRPATDYIMDPKAWRRVRWDLLMLVLLLYSGIIIPLKMAFSDHFTSSLNYVDTAVDLVYMTDVCIQFMTAYYDDDGTMVINPHDIAKRYFHSWFWIDFLGSIPLDLLQVPRRVSIYLGVFRLFKLVRLYRYMSALEHRIENFVSPTKVRLMIIIIFMLFFWHFVACCYWAVGTSRYFGFKTWMPNISESESDGLTFKYLSSIMWTIQTTFSCQPQQIPGTVIETTFATICVILGVCMNAVVIGSASSTLQSLDAEKEARRQRMNKITSYMARRKIPGYFRRIVIDYYNFMSDRAAEASVITELPMAIQGRLQLLLNRDLVKQMPVLRQLELHTIVTLMQALEPRLFLPGEFVFRTGDKAKHIFFLKTGELHIVQGTGQGVLGNVGRGELVGQVAFMAGEAHQFSVRAAIYTEALMLSRQDYDEIAADSPRFIEMVDNEALKQEQYIEKNLSRTRKVKIEPKNPTADQGSKMRTATRKSMAAKKDPKKDPWGFVAAKLQAVPLRTSLRSSKVLAVQRSTSEASRNSIAEEEGDDVS